MQVDPAGNVLIFGVTGSPDFPLLHPFDDTWATRETGLTLGDPTDGAGECFVAKFSPDGELCWSSFLGGSGFEGNLYGVSSGVVWYNCGWERGEGWVPSAVDDEGNFYVGGITFSADFPLVNAFDDTMEGDRESFLAKITPDGTIAWSTFSDSWPYVDWVYADYCDIAVRLVPDAFGNLYVVGQTGSPMFPTPNGFDTVFGDGTTDWPEGDAWPAATGTGDSFVLMLDPQGSMRWGTYLGGARNDYGGTAYTSPDGGILTAGQTLSRDFPLLAPFQDTYGGDGRNLPGDGFLAGFSPWGSLVWSSFAGGRDIEGIMDVAVCDSGAVYAAGSTNSQDWPTPNPNPASSCRRCFLLKIAPARSGEFAVLTNRLPKGFVGVPYSAAIEAAGDAPPFVWSMFRGSLPDGLTLDPATAAITGTPTREGKSIFTARVNDSHDPARILIAPLNIVVVNDAAPPRLSDLAAPATVRERLDNSIAITAYGDDRGAGDSLITAAEYFIDSAGSPGTGIPMAASDGEFDSKLELVAATIDTSSWRSPGSHAVYVRVRDEAGRWSDLGSISVDVVDVLPPGTVTDLAFEFSYLHELVATTSWRLEGLADTSEQSTIIDLGTLKPIVGVSLAPEAVLTYFPRAFSIWTSPDAANWTRIALQSDWKPVRGPALWQCEPEVARYVKIEAVPVLDRKAETYSVAVGEVKVYITDPDNPVVIRWTATEEDGCEDANASTEYDLGIGFRWFQPPAVGALEPLATAAPKQPGEAEEISFDLGWRFGTLWGILKSVDADSNWSGPSNTAAINVLPEGFQPNAPAEGEAVSRLVARQFSFFRGAGLKNMRIAFSDRAGFPNRAIRQDDLVSKTVRFPVKLNSFWWKPSRSQWRTLINLGSDSGRLYWRVEGKTLTNTLVIGPTRSMTIPAP